MLGVFSGIEVMFFWLGFFTLAVLQGLFWLRYRYKAGWGSLVLLLAGSGTVLFAVAWAVSSILEGEPQSASMSMIVMLLPGLIIGTLGARMVWSQNKQVV